MWLLQTSVVDIADSLSSGTGPSTQFDFGRIFSGYVGVIILVAAILTFLYLVLGGIQWITAGGDTGKVTKARERITQAVIGLAVVTAAWAIFAVVQYFLGIDFQPPGSGRAPSSSSQSSGSGSGGGGGDGVFCEIGVEYNDGGAGGYCTNGGAAIVKCVAPGVGPSKFNYRHYEPCRCADPKNTILPGYSTSGCQ